MRKIARVTGAGLVALFVSLFVAFTASGGVPASAGDVTIQVAIDLNTAGNGDNVLGPTESCNDTPLQVGDTIDVDIVVRGVPAYDSSSRTGGIRGTDLDLLFNPAVVQVKLIQGFAGPTILKARGQTDNFESLQYPGGGPPGVFGDVFAGMSDLSNTPSSGDGVLVRITLQAVGAGISKLDLAYVTGDEDKPQIYEANENVDEYLVTDSDAHIVVASGDCSSIPATPTPTATLVHFTPTFVPTPPRTSTPPTPTPTLAASASPSTTARELPRTGGKTSGGTSYPYAIALIAAAAVATGAFVYARRRL